MHKVLRTPATAWLLFGMLSLAALSGCHRDSGKPRISGPLAGKPVFNGGEFRLGDLGYQKQEFFFSGTATSYKPAGPLGEDGRWAVQPAATAPFTSRMVVIRPMDASKFNGTVIVEWLNVTSGAENPAEWTYTHRELLRSGFAYVGVSAQRVGIEGGKSYFGGGKALKQINRERYERLHHPGDAFSYDIFSQAGQYIRADAGSLLGPLKPQRLIAVGESQSAIFLTTYVNAVDPPAKVFDGYLIHSRFGFASGLAGALDSAVARGQAKGSPVRIRDDVRVPVLMTITETDLLAAPSTFLRVRQPDSAHIHTWEIAGTAHADNYVFGLGNTDFGTLTPAQMAAGFRLLDTIGGKKLDAPINSAPQHHYVEEAALRSLNRWVAEGVAPPSAPALAVTDHAFALDPNGNALGGIRSPWVDVPTAALSGLGQSGSALLGLLGTTKPFSAAQLHALYPRGKAEYLDRFRKSLEDAIAAGSILAADRDEIVSLAAASYPR